MRLLALALTLAAPAPALALSCMPHPIEAAYTQAAESADTYVVVQGKLSFDPAQLPKADPAQENAPPKGAEIAAHLEGRMLGAEGFASPVDLDLTLVALCYGPWCAGAQDGVESLAFLRETAAGYVLETNPCGGFLFQKPTPEMTARVAECFNGADCRPDAP